MAGMGPPFVRQRGFTWLEMLMVIAVIAILSLMAIPSLQETAIKKQVKEGLSLAEVATKAVQGYYAGSGEWPADNKVAGAPAKEKIVGNLVTEAAIANGAVTITFGNNANKNLEGKRVTLRPAFVPGERAVPVAWLCHAAKLPRGMEVQGRDDTDITDNYLPLECRYVP